MIGGARRAAGVAHAGGEFGDEGTQTVNGRSVFGEVRVDFLKRGHGALGRCDRIARCLGGLILIGEQQRPPRFDQMPFDVVGEHAEEDVRPHSALEPVVDRADLQVHGF
jgi:hypothetical protein